MKQSKRNALMKEYQKVYALFSECDVMLTDFRSGWIRAQVLLTGQEWRMRSSELRGRIDKMKRLIDQRQK